MAVDLNSAVQALGKRRDYLWAWHSFKDTVMHLAEQTHAQTLMEVGAGRKPLFTANTAQNYSTYILNDIDPDELTHANGEPAGAKRLICDIAAKHVPYPSGSIDILCSRMVFEHVKDAPQAYRNVHALLRPGGVAINFIPTLYSTPFIINAMLPERLSAAAVNRLHPDQERTSKFPTHYHWCKSTDHVRDAIKDIGFSDVAIVPFYGHDYFQKIPVLGALDAVMAKVAEHEDWRSHSSYAYIMAMK